MKMYFLLKQSKYIEIIAILLIVVFAAILRLHKLDTAPYGTLVDEASYGYIAHSLAQTGKDELGNSLPLTFKAFGDYKLPIYGYLLVPIVKTLGLSNFSVRLPSALAGVFLIYLAYLVLKQLRFSSETSLVGAAIVAFSPWTILLSRLAFESNIALFLLVFSIFTFLRHIETKKTHYLVIASVLMGLTWYSYIAYRLTTSGIIIASIVYFYASKKINKKQIIIFLIAFIVTVLPLAPSILSRSGVARFNQIGFLSNESTIHEINELRGLCYKDWPTMLCNILANRPIAWIEFIFQNLFSSLSFEYLFLSGEKILLYLSVPGYGVFPQIVILLYFFGLFALSSKLNTPTKLGYFLLLIFFALLPSSLVGIPQRVRLSAVLPFLIFLFSLGYEKIILKTEVYRPWIRASLTFISIALICLYGFAYSLNLIYIHFTKFTQEYAGPLRGAIAELQKNYKNTDTYFSSDLHDAIIHYAFYSKVAPGEYQKHAIYSKPDDGGFSHPISYKNIYTQSKSLNEMYCEQKIKGRDFVLVTPSNLEQTGESFEPPVFRYLSHDKNSTLMYLYFFKHTNEIECAN